MLATHFVATKHFTFVISWPVNDHKRSVGDVIDSLPSICSGIMRRNTRTAASLTIIAMEKQMRPGSVEQN
jgi:hypothetical protein